MPSGSVQTVEVEGEDPAAARRSLEAKGYFVFEQERRAEAWRLPRLALSKRDRISQRALLIFNQELLALVKAGLPILAALDLLGERSQQARLRTLLADVRDSVKGGTALSASLARHPRFFPPLFTSALQAGEQSGNFVDALSRYVEYQKRMLALRQRLRAAFTYPVILCVASTGVIVFLLTYVVPTFTKIYGDMDAQLPAATRLLLATTGHIRTFAPLAVVAIVLAVVAAWRWRATPKGRITLDRWLLALPWVGETVRGYLYSRFARTLAMMLAGGIPMIPSLKTTLATVGNAHLADALSAAIPRVAAGSRLADALGRAKVVPPLMLELVAVGEGSGSLGEMLGHVAEMLDTETDTRLNTLAALIEPVIMIGMGLVVASIVVTMYLPIFNLSSVVR
ncbi:MAG TPA: type II secretion system F family protein [Candidatus Sulfotelmatobacter sp.]|nr:type II secretion system F family protein [Candidatus Sulfotelmatobacter sp.]